MIEKIRITSLSGRGSVTMETKTPHGFWLGPVDWGQVEGQHQTYSYYNQVGANIVSTSIQTRPLSITGWVMDIDGGLQERCDFLNMFISPTDDYTLEYNGKAIKFRPDKSIIYSPEYKKNNELVRRFLIQATCAYPLFTDYADTDVPFEAQKKLFHFPTDWGQGDRLVFAVTSKAYSMEIVNGGGFQTGLVVSIKFSGEVVNPRIKNLTTGKFTGLTRTFQSGDKVEISTVQGSKYMRLNNGDGTYTNIIKDRDYRTGWIQLAPGANLLALDCDDLDQRGNMAVTVSFTPLYMEVE